MKFGEGNYYHQPITDYILGEIVLRTREKDTTKKFDSSSNRCWHFTGWQYMRHAASTGLASPSNICSGGGITWQRAVFSNL